jgi:hypothetical protein
MSEAGFEETPSTDRLVDALVDDVRPVRRIQPLVWVAAGVTFADLLWWGIGVRWLAGATSPSALAAALTDGFVVGLVTTLAGATGQALAGREPGREGLGRVSWALLGSGAGAACVTFVMRSWDAAGGTSLKAALQCAEHALALGIIPAAVLLFVVLGGWRGRPRATSVAAGVSGVSLGALMVQATCPESGAWHVMLGHYVGPLVAAAGLAAVGTACWRRWLDR